MTNKPMLSVERELLERFVSDVEAHNYGFDGLEEMRAILDAQHIVCSNGILCQNSKCAECGGNGSYKPAAQHQGEPVAVVIEETHNYGGYLVFGGGNTGVQRPRPVVERKAHLLDRALPAGTQLYAEQTAPVAVVMPDDWEDQLFAEMSRRFDLRKQIDDDHMVYDDTQIGVEFARDWIKARLNGVKP